MRDSNGKKVTTAITFCVLMILMTQTGYLDNVNPWSASNKTLDDTEPVVAYSPSTSVMYGNNTAWTSTIGPIKHAEYIALAYDAVLFQAAPNKNSMKGCPMAYNASNATVWQPITGSTSLCGGMVGRYVAMIDDITYFTFTASTSSSSNGLGGDLYAYNPGNDTIYLISNQNGRVQTGVGIGRTIYFTSHTYSPSFAVNLMSYNVDNQTTSTLSSPGYYQDRLMVVGSKILTYSPIGTMGSEAFNPENSTWYSVPSLPSKGIFGDPAPGLVSNGQLLFVGTDAATVASSTSGNGSEYWIYDSNNDTAWPLGDFCIATACNGGLPFYEDDGLPQVRDGTDMYFIARSYDSSTSNPSNGDTMYDLWGYSTLNATTWHMTNLTATFNYVGSYNTGDHRAHIKLAMLANGDFVISSSTASSNSAVVPTHESAFYSPTNDTIWQPTLCSSCGNSQGTSGVDAQHSRLLGVYGNTVYFAKYGALLAYNVENQTAASQIIPGAATSYLNGAPVLFGSTFAMAHHCGDGTASSCPNGQRNTFLQWAPESVTVSDAWNLTPGQRIDGPITGGNGIHTSSGIGVQNLTASAEGAELLVGQAMTNITFQYNASAASGSGSGSSSSSAFAYANDKFSAGAEHNCAILANGDLKCWGWDLYGQLGDGATTGDKTSPQSTPVNLGSGRTAVAVAAGGTTSCAILDNGELKCWGRDNYGQIGNGGSSHNHNTQATSPGNPINLGTNRTAVAVAAGGSHTCAILDNGDLKCWGRDYSGQLGDGGPAWTSNNPTDTYAPSSTAINLGSGRTAVAVSAGGAHTCAILDNGELKCWGSDLYGQLGNGGTNHSGFGRTDTNAPNSTAIDLGAGRTAVAVSAYWSNTCAILDNGEVKCWGRNREGQLGDGSNTDSTTPSSTAINLGAGRTAVALSGGYDHTCAILDNGDLKCWGNDGSGQLGDGGSVGSTNAPSSTAIDLGTGRTAVAVAPGNQHTCALLDNGSAMCWGVDNSGQLGTAGSNQGKQYSPVFVSGNNLWNSSTGATSGSGSGMTNVTGASCSVSPSLLAGLSIDSSTCTISGTPTVETSNTTYTVTAVISGVTYQTSVWLSSANQQLTPSVEGADLIIDEPMTNITFQYNASAASGSGGGMTNVTGATCTVSPALPTGLSIDSGTCTISGTPTVTSSNTTYTVTTNISNVTYEGSVWLSASSFGTITSAVEGGALNFGEAMTPITLNYASQAGSGTAPTTWETEPPLPTGISISGGTISGTPSVYASNQTYTIYANQSGYSATHELYFSVDTNNPHTVLENQAIDPIGFHPPFNNGTTTWTVSPALPGNLSINGSTGEITGLVNGTLADTAYTVTATHNGSATENFSFNLRSLADYDGDGLPNDLPGDYDAAEGPTPGLVADTDDDADGLSDDVETNTGYYANETNTGTDALNPDTDGDGICDGPLAVPGVCIAGPDPAPFGSLPTIVGVNNSALPAVNPYISGAAFTYEVSPDLPSALSLDSATGIISGTPNVTISNTTYTIFANLSSGESYNWTVTIEILEDSDGDGLPDSLPSDYNGSEDSIRDPPGLTEDLDDDNDGSSDLNESSDGTDSLNPDTDGDGFCDGINTVPGVCFAGPDPYPNDPNLPLDTDGDGLPDDDSDWTGPPYADDDDDNDGYPDTSEENCGSDPLNASNLPNDLDGDGICDDSDDDIDGDGIDNVNETGLPIGTSPTNPDTDGDGVCDGPESPVTSNCTAGPDAFPLDPGGWEDTDGDGHPNELFPPSNSDPALIEDLDDDNDGWSDIDEVNCGSDPLNATDSPIDLNGDGVCDNLDDDWDDDGIPNANETDTGVYNGSNDTGTDPWNPDTDGDGWCDGPVSVMNGSNTTCVAGPDPFPHDPNLPIDTDGDGMPNELPDGYVGTLIEDDDDDNDNFLDTEEADCSTDPVNNTSYPNDMDGDGICDTNDPDIDGDGIANEDETGAPDSTDSLNPDTDGDGICDGPAIPANGGCVVGPDAFPLDRSAHRDTDGDGMPDELTGESTSEPVLIEDLDDDNDTWSDEDELACSSSPVNAMDVPADADGDGICDALDEILDLPFTLEYPTTFIDLIVNQNMDPVLPYINGSGEVATWEIVGTLPDGLTFGISEARSAGQDGGIRGTPLNSTDPISVTIWANNSNYQQSFSMSITVFSDNDGDLIPDYIPESYVGNANLTSDDDDDNDGANDTEEIECGSDPLDPESTPTGDPNSSCYIDESAPLFSIWWCCLLFLIILLILFLISIIRTEKPEVVLLPQGPEPEFTDSHPVMWEGKGTEQDPFVLRSLKGVEPGSVHLSKEKITITNMTVPKIEMVDYNVSSNNRRFKMQKKGKEPTLDFDIDESGKVTFNIVFDDSENPSEEGTEYKASLKVGTASVYFNWKVSIAGESDDSEKELVDLEKESEDDSEAEDKKKAEDKAKKDAEKKAKEEEKARLKAEKEAEKQLLAKKKEEAAAKKKAKAEAKAAKEADDKAKAEQEAKEAQEKEKAEAKAKEEAEAKAKAAAKKAEKKPVATKEAKKQEELQRVKQRAKSIDFKVLGKASSSKLKREVKKGATTLEVANAKDFAESGSAEINDTKGSTIIAWTGKDGNTLTGVSGVTRVFSAKAALVVKDDLQVIKGIGPFIEEKLNALGITTYRQLANMTAKLETQVNEAIEFFSGRVKRDQWVAQAKILLGEDVKLDEKALKQAEELERIAKKAEGIDFGILGVASASEADDLQKIKGIGPFIAEKLNALGIFKFSQLANMTSEIEEEVNIAIEFFPGRVKRDEWVKQAKEFIKEK